jgi:predicted dehydrogenase
MQKVKVGLVGCGAISPAYLRNFTTHFQSILEVKACADLIPTLAIKQAEDFQIPRVCNTEDLLADPEIEIVVNLTFANQHFAVSQAILQAGKHLFTEKPLAVERQEGSEILDLAKRKGLLLAGAADIFLGAGLQTCRALLDQNAIGIPLLASAFIALNYGNAERWQQRGTGPVFDMGPYYLTALVALLGPVRQVTSMTSNPIPQKPYPVDSPDYGKVFTVGTPMEAAGLLRFESGLLGVFAACGEASEGYVPRLEFYGSGGTLQANDPNMYYRPVVLRGGAGKEVPIRHGFIEEGRGLGVAEMAWALRTGRQPRASGEILYHVLEIMHAIHEASDQCKQIELHSTCTRPEPFDLNEMLEAFTS